MKKINKKIITLFSISILLFFGLKFETSQATSLEEVKSNIEKKNEEISKNNKNLEALNTEINSLNEKIKENNIEIESLIGKQKQLKSQTDGQMKALQLKGTSQPEFLAIIFNSENISSKISEINSVQTLIQDTQKNVNDLKKSEKEMKNTQKTLDESKKNLDNKKQKTTEMQSKLNLEIKELQSQLKTIEEENNQKQKKAQEQAIEEARLKNAEITKKEEEEIKVEVAAEQQTSKPTMSGPRSFSAGQEHAAFEQICADYNISGETKTGWAFIIEHESGWDSRATNPTSSAYGLPQSLPGSKMAAAGSDWETNPYTQLVWMFGYMNERYGSVAGAVSFWQTNKWY